MSIFDKLPWRAAREVAARAQPRSRGPSDAVAQTKEFSGLNDPALLEYIRRGQAGGDYGRRMAELRNMTALRCVSLICESMGMLPLNLIRNDASKALAIEHPAYRLLKRKPNSWQTPYEFKSQMQLNVLTHGNAYARVVWSRGNPIGLYPMDPRAVSATLSDDWQITYRYTRPDGATVDLVSKEVLHLRDLSADGVLGMSRMRLAHDALELAKDAERAASRVFRTGVMAGGAIEVPKALSDVAYGRMRQSLDEDYAGAENAQKWMLLEEGAKSNPFQATSAASQHIENRNAQIEEVLRAFGVPRPLAMMDDTSWGSGIEQLGIFFVQYGLAHWFTCWEQACGRVLLDDSELEDLIVKFNERALLRGTLADQAEFFAKALGAGGQRPWMTQNEVRENSDLPESSDSEANQLRNPMTQPRKPNEPPAAA
ncbi:phage portal protein [Dyella marensis]|uniref:Phage portal protein, HK97 family n=1 Tax=Dyella marensis TaxID=500610 RepID=A0A1I1ZYJ2_9GAMM|nr:MULTISPECIES: phage portal protein [Dyella]SFE36735.1 phage portal protein, HK97 family [Dyella marensis]